MSATAAGHPPASVLAAYALGKLDAAAAESVHAHLTGCADCRTAVETTPNDSLMALFRRAAAGDGITLPPSQPGSVTRGTRSAPHPPGEPDGVPPELGDHPRYRIARKLGQGGMGAVYQAEHKLMGRVVAVKVISPALVDSPEAVERFDREIKAAARLDHPNIVRAYDADNAGGAMLLVMEYVPGRTLADMVAAKGPLGVGSACRCARQAAVGLQHAFELGMVHRDIKPQNLMLTDKGVVKVLDFGLAKLASERAIRSALTAHDVGMGTPEYMAPEQARDAAAADVRADIYSLGCTLFYLLTGRPPFTGRTPFEVMTKHLMDTPTAVAELRPDVPSGLARLIGRMLAKDPAARPQTPREVADVLAPFAKDAPHPADPPAAGPRVGGDTAGAPVADPVPASTPHARRRQWAPAAAAVAVGLVLCVGPWAARRIGNTPPAGAIILTVSEAGAEVFLDGALVAVTGAGDRVTIPAPAGGTLEVRKSGFRPYAQELQLNSGERRELAVFLEPEAVAATPAMQFVAPDQARRHVGRWCIIEMTVRTVGKARTADRYYLNSDTYGQPDNFTVTFLGQVLRQFRPAGISEVKDFEQKTIRVTGKVTEFLGKPQIVIDDPAQVQILETGVRPRAEPRTSDVAGVPSAPDQNERATAPAAGAADGRVFELRTYTPAPGKPGAQTGPLHDRAAKLIASHGETAIGYWVPVDGTDNRLVCLLAHANRDAADRSWKALSADPEWERVRRETEADGPLATKVERLFLTATGDAATVQPGRTDVRLVYELGVFAAPPAPPGAVAARFRAEILPLFGKYGMIGVGYWAPMADQPGAGSTLVYMLAHRSANAARESWGKVRADSDWPATEKSSEANTDGSSALLGGAKSIFLKPAEFLSSTVESKSSP